MKKYGKSAKKGFTLVELIVVLVILAVLAAMLVPALTGYIKRARQEKDYQFAATVLTAAQSAATFQYSKGNDNGTITQSTATTPSTASSQIYVKDLVGANSKTSWSCTFSYADGIIKSGDVTITNNSKSYTYHWDGSVWTAKAA